MPGGAGVGAKTLHKRELYIGVDTASWPLRHASVSSPTNGETDHRGHRRADDHPSRVLEQGPAHRKESAPEAPGGLAGSHATANLFGRDLISDLPIGGGIDAVRVLHGTGDVDTALGDPNP
jgi:hypothetical protein